MKTFVTLALALGISLTIQSQVDCSSMCVTNLELHQMVEGYTMLVTVQYNNQEVDTHLNYPYVAAVVVNNDTIAQGWMNYFAQLNNTDQQYDATTVLTSLPNDFTCTVHFRFDNTECLLPYPCTSTVSIEEEEATNVSIYPNPASEVLYIQNDRLLFDNSSRVKIYSTDGRLLIQSSFSTAIDIQHLNEGTYILCMDRKVIRFTKNRK